MSIHRLIHLIASKSKPPIIWFLLNEPIRFGGLYKAMSNIAVNVLSIQLKELEADEIVSQKA